MNIIIVSDFLFSEISGGAETSDLVLFSLLKQNGYNVVHIKCIDLGHIKNNELYIISNFTMLSEHNKKILIHNHNYILYQHDFQCFAERHPTRYKEENYFVPKDQLRNVDFYKSAKLVICQTNLQKEIIEKNLELTNCWSLDGNLYSKHELDFLQSHIGEEKNGLYAIINDDNPIKGKKDAIRYADKNKLQYGLISNKNRLKFFEELSKFNGIILMPTILESCSRLAIEAKLMGLEVISRNCPIMLQDFDLESITNCREKVLNKISEVVGE